MSDALTAPTRQPEPRHFRPRWVRFVLAGAAALGACGLVASISPAALLFAAPCLALALALAAFGNAGLALTREGVAWYALHPRWRFRMVPWDSVLGARRGPTERGPIRLSVEAGRYEAWVWGNPRGDRQCSPEIWVDALIDGDEVLGAIEDWLRWRDREVEPGTAGASPVGTVRP
jgi:hypothetical protein